ncbi:MAG: M28 family peptidase, partial [Bacteroidota bacterium]
MKTYLKWTLLITLLVGNTIAAAQNDDEDAFSIRKIYDIALTEGQCYDWLSYLTKRIGPRLAGSAGAAAAVEYGKQMFDTLGFDKVYLQECMVPHWERGEPEIVRIVNSETMGSITLNALALGYSGATPEGGLTAEVIEAKGLEALEAMSEEDVRGKIVFFSKPMDPTQVNTFAAYASAVGQRTRGPREAAKKGALGTIVRSMTLKLDDEPHSGVTIFEEGQDPIPALAISTNDAVLLGRILEREPVRMYLNTTCQRMSDKVSYNVVGEITGSTYPDEIILVGGHLDSWDINEGAHDDGAGCVQSLDVIYNLQRFGWTPKRTIRCVWFMNEENGQAGAIEYANVSNAIPENHIAAIESDAGGFTPRSFSTEADESVYIDKLRIVKKWETLLAPYGIVIQSGGGSGADIRRLRPQNGLLFGLRPDSQRYFDFHHSWHG